VCAEGDVLGGLGLAVDREPDGGSAEFLVRDVHRGERGDEVEGLWDVVVPDRGDVRRHPKVCLAQGVQHTGGDDVGGCEDRGRGPSAMSFLVIS
jgi:hypothetical protein